MLGTRYTLLAGVAALGLAASLPARSCDDHAARTDAAKAQPAAVKTASGAACTAAPVAPAAFAARSQAAMKQAARDGRLVMVNLTNANDTGAKICPVMAAKMARAGDKASACCDKDGAAIQAAQKRFVTLQVNPNDCAGSKAFAAKYNVKTYPTTLFLDAKGKEVHRVAGALEPARLAAAMDTALAKAGKTKTARS